MKGFKPTGYGPSSGFKFPASFGFTGSTGAYTNVQPYVRQKPRAFKDGGYVSEKLPDPGHATVQRSRPYTEEDRESGGRSPLRPGYKKGGRMKKMKKADGGKVVRPKGMGAMSDREVQMMLRKAMPKKPTMPATGMKGKFAAADGGKVEYEKPTYMSAVKDRIKEMLGLAGQSMSSGMAGQAARKISERQRQIDDATDQAVTGKTSASNYSRGGKMKRMGYAKGGGVSADQAKKIAQSTVGEHVRYPAPKGHKGLGKMCK